MQLLKHFKALTLNPNNAQELKGLILQLAVQGKLTAQWREENPNVEPTSVLLEEIISWHVDFAKKNGRRIGKIKSDELENIYLPQGWIPVNNHQLFSLRKGKNPKDLSESQKKYFYQDIEALDRGNVRRYSNDEKAPRCSDADILVVCDGSRSGLLLEGKSGIVGSTLAIIETPPFIIPFVKLIFLQNFQRVNDNMIGAAIPHLDTKTLLNETIGLPPLEEQKAIVAVVNALFKEVEQLERLTQERVQLKTDFVTSALQRLTQASAQDTATEWAFLQAHFGTFFTEKENVKKLRESILQLAVQGKITQHWRSQNPEVEGAAVLLDHIKTEKAQLVKDKTIKKEAPLPAITEDEIPYALAEGWVWCRIGDVITLKSGQDLKPHEYSDHEEIGLPYITGASNLQNEKVIVSRWTNAPRSIAFRGDLLLTCKGSGVGKMGWLKEDQAHIARQIMAVNTIGADLKFVKNFLDIKLKYFKEAANGLIPGIDRKTVLEMPFSFPPLEEQKAIVSKVNALMALCDNLVTEIETHQIAHQDWMRSCLGEVLENKEEEDFTEENKPNLKCPSCGYQVYNECLGYRGGYCKPAVCKKCKNIYSINTEFCGEPEEVNACHNCGAYEYKIWDQNKRPCPKCGQKMEILDTQLI